MCTNDALHHTVASLHKQQFGHGQVYGVYYTLCRPSSVNLAKCLVQFHSIHFQSSPGTFHMWNAVFGSQGTSSRFEWNLPHCSTAGSTVQVPQCKPAACVARCRAGCGTCARAVLIAVRLILTLAVRTHAFQPNHSLLNAGECYLVSFFRLLVKNCNPALAAWPNKTELASHFSSTPR